MTRTNADLVMSGAVDLWDACHALGVQLDEWQRRLANSAAEFGEGDTAEIDRLAALAGELRTRYRSSPVLRPDEDSELVRLYEAPISADALGSSLDDLVRRAAQTRDQVRARLAGGLSIVPTCADEEPGELVYPELLERDASGALVPVVASGSPRGWDPWRVATEVCTAVGVLIVVFVLYATVGTGLSAARSQRALEREFDARLRSAVAAANQATGTDVQESGVLTGGDDQTAEPEEIEEAVVLGPPERGDPVAVLSLPTIGVRDVVVEGTRAQELAAGPGHLRSTPLPGRVGNAVVFGRRTTYGGPFARLDDLQPGDPMDVMTTEGVFRYVVQEVRRVGTGEPDPIGTTFTNRLTLVTADERYAAHGRLVAIGLLEGAPVASPTTADGGVVPLPPVNPDELGTERTGTDWALVLIWTQVLVLAYLGARWLYRHWLPWSSWLVSAPVVLVVTFAWLDSLTRLFPSTL